MLIDRRWGCGVSEAMSRRVGRTTWSESVTPWHTGLIVDPVLRISGVAGGRKEMSRGSENPTKRKRVGGTREKGSEARAA